MHCSVLHQVTHSVQVTVAPPLVVSVENLILVVRVLLIPRPTGEAALFQGHDLQSLFVTVHIQ